MYLNKVLMIIVASTAIIGTAFGADDKSDSQPQKVHIAIVGGGISGLTAAYYLHSRHLDLHVFEARDRLGGRVNTHYFDKEKTQYFEEGGATIDSDHKHMIHLAKLLKVPLIQRGMGDGKLSVIHEGQEVNSDVLVEALKESATFFAQQWSFIENDANKLVHNVNGVWVYRPFSSILESCPNLVAKAFWKNYIEDEYGVGLESVPIVLLNELKERAKEYAELIEKRSSPWVPDFLINQVAYSYRVEGGMSRLVGVLEHQIKQDTKTYYGGAFQGIRKGATIHYEYILQGIRKPDATYHLDFTSPQGRKTVIADKVVMTIPFSVLRDVAIDPSVGLTDLQMLAIHTLPYGTNGKIGVPIHEPFSMLYHINLDQQFDSWPERNALTFMLGGSAGENLTQEQAESLVEGERPILEKSYPAIKTLGNPVIKNWSQDPFSKGSYSAKNVKADVSLWTPSRNPDFDGMWQFAESVPDGTFIFAGEHTRADGSQGFIEGAVRSGISAYRLLLKKKV